MKHALFRPTALLVVISVAFGFLLSNALPTTAQDQPPLVVAVLDIPKVMRETKAAKAVRSQIEKQQEAYKAELVKQENALRAADQQLANQRASLSAEQFQQKRQDLENQLAKLRENVQKRNRQLEDSLKGGMDQVRQSLVQIVAGIAQQRGLTLVLDKSDVVLSANAFDITAQAMQQLDAKLPTVKIARPK